MAKIGIIGGSGLYAMEGLTITDEASLLTPFGQPSCNYKIGWLDEIEVVFLPRHGVGHKISPSEINYRANIFGMKKLGVDGIFSVSAVGSLKEEIKPMDFVVPDQLVDLTRGQRPMSFFGDGVVAHCAFAEPFSAELREALIAAGKELSLTAHDGGTYVNIEGPQFSTRAESELYRSWGMDIIGMTNATEARLAREAEISYATLAAVTDYDCWHPSHESVTVEMILEYLKSNVSNAQKILKTAIRQAGKREDFSAVGAMKSAVVTDPAHILQEKRTTLEPLIGKYLG